jgi:N-acetylmuramoyl-L-alanine amidase
MSARTPRLAVALMAAVASFLVIASCSAPVESPPPRSAASASDSASVSAGPPVTVPALSSAVPSPSAQPSPSPTEEPTTEPAPSSEEADSPAEPAPQEPPQVEQPAPAPAPAPEPAPPPAPVSGGKVVVIDPGHNGANGANPSIINALVDAGFGKTKPCNTTGTETNAGYTEHRFTWAVANDLKDILESNGITVIMTRDSDDGVGPCVNKRAAIGNNANADLVLSIHGDGVDTDSDRGFYVMTAQRDPAGAAMAAQSARLASTIRDGLVSAGLSPSNYLGNNGLWQRDDLAGLNLSTRPTVMVESGNMRSSADAALMSSEAGQQQFAKGYASGVLSFLGRGAG